MQLSPTAAPPPPLKPATVVVGTAGSGMQVAHVPAVVGALVLCMGREGGGGGNPKRVAVARRGGGRRALV